MPEHPTPLDEHGHPIVVGAFQWGADPTGDPAHYGSDGDPAIAARIRTSRQQMLVDPGPVLDLAVPR